MHTILLALNLALSSTTTTVPTPSQDSINVAMKMYSIQQSDNCESPTYDGEAAMRLEAVATYDPNFIERGVYTYRGVYKKGTVRIGVAAFSSWGMLASTLAHEIEVHCNQSVLEFKIGNLLGYDMIAIHEWEAYLYEIKNKDRFGLTDKEVSDIFHTAEVNYGDL